MNCALLVEVLYKHNKDLDKPTYAAFRGCKISLPSCCSLKSNESKLVPLTLELARALNMLIRLQVMLLRAI